MQSGSRSTGGIPNSDPPELFWNPSQLLQTLKNRLVKAPPNMMNTEVGQYTRSKQPSSFYHQLVGFPEENKKRPGLFVELNRGRSEHDTCVAPANRTPLLTSQTFAVSEVQQQKEVGPIQSHFHFPSSCTLPLFGKGNQRVWTSFSFKPPRSEQSEQLNKLNGRHCPNKRLHPILPGKQWERVS